MSDPKSLRNGRRIFTSFLLSLILIGSTISSALLLGLAVVPQQAWAALPGAPGLSSPSNGSTTFDQTPTFDWNSVSASPAVTSYNLLVDNNADFLSPEINVNVNAPTTDFTPSSNLAFGTYNWKVRAHNSDGDGLYSSVRTVTIADLPAPTLSSPADNAFINDPTPTLDFNRISSEPSGLLYQIQADNSGSGFPSPEVDNIQSSSDSSEFTPSAIADGTYSWRVGAKSDAADPPTWSTVRTFILDTAPPAAPSLIFPGSESGGFTNDQTPLFDWNDATDPNGINRYQIQLSTSSSLQSGPGSAFSSTSSPGFSTNLDGSPPNSQFQQGSNLPTNTILYWHVRARDSANNFSPYGPTFSFTIDTTLPGQPTLTAPANGVTITDNTPTFTWNAVSDPSSPVTYELLVDNENTFAGPFTISEPSLTSPMFIPSSIITPDGLYFWKVRAKDGAGNIGTFSATFSFNIDSTGPTVTASPTAGTFGPTLQVTLSSLNTDLAAIYYTTDGSNPDNTDNLYSGPISITTTTTLKFIGYDTLGNAGPVGTEVYTIDSTGPTVTATPATSTFGPSGTSVTLSSLDTDLDSIFYTTDGSTPDNSGSGTATEYSGAISISTTTTLKFIGYDTLGNAGPVGTETYTLDNTGPTVTASPTGGTFSTAQSVTLSSAAPDLDSIFYTIDGSTPDNSDTEYTGPISITTTTTLKFIGYDTLGNAGPVGTETYTIEIVASIDTALSLRLSTNVNVPSELIPSSLQNLLDSVANIPITGGSTYTASGKLIDPATNTPLSGKTITITTDGSSPVTATTNNNGVFTVQLTAPNFPGKHDVQAHYAGDSQYNPSDSQIRKLVVIGVNHITLLSLSLGDNNVPAGSTYTASGKLVALVGLSPLSGKTITITTDGSSPVTATTNNNGVFTVQLTAPNNAGLHDIQAHFAGDSQYKSSKSTLKKLIVTENNLAITATNLDTTLNLKLDGNDEINPDSTYSAYGKLVDSVSKKPIADKTITITTDGESKVTDTTDRNGEFELSLKAPDSPGKHDVQAHFAGDSQYKPSDSAERNITVKAANLQSEEKTVAEDEEQPDGDTEEQPDGDTEDTEEQPDGDTEDTEEQEQLVE